MPFSNRTHETGTTHPVTRRMLRSVDFRRSTKNGNGNGTSRGPRIAPPESTNAESFYYLKQMNTRTPMVIVMTDGEQIRGWIEWYDKTCIKVNREDAPNLLIQKRCIKYLFKQDELSEY
jgi:sRNA-binding regulator protein Hfq